MTAYEAYKKYMAIRLHYQSDSYDYFKYNGSVKTTESKFDTRKDKYFFHKLSKMDDIELFLACNLRDDCNVWIGNLFDEKYKENYVTTNKTIQSLQYTFELDLSKYYDLNEGLNVVNGEYPKMLSDYNRKEIHHETLVILNDTLKVFDYWEKELNDRVLFPTIRFKLEKYSPFVRYDRKKFQKLLLDNYQC